MVKLKDKHVAKTEPSIRPTDATANAAEIVKRQSTANPKSAVKKTQLK